MYILKATDSLRLEFVQDRDAYGLHYVHDKAPVTGASFSTREVRDKSKQCVERISRCRFGELATTSRNYAKVARPASHYTKPQLRLSSTKNKPLLRLTQAALPAYDILLHEQQQGKANC